MGSVGLDSVAFIDALRGWAVGDGVVRKTVDGGLSWTSASVPPRLRAVAFDPTGTVGYAVGYGGAARINPGAASVIIEPAVTSDFYAVALPTATTGIAVGSHGLVAANRALGTSFTWTPFTYGFGPGDLFGVATPDASHIWVVGQGLLGGGSITASFDGGATWNNQGDLVQRTNPFYAVDFVDTMHGWAVGRDGVVFATENGGRSAPRITDFTPTSGPVSTTVTINGRGFLDASAVTFNEKAAQFVVVESGVVKATVPAGATTGQITVTTPYGSDTSSQDFKVVAAARRKPKLSKLSPAKGKIGCKVTLTGSDFGKKRGSGVVTFGSQMVTKYVTWSDTKIKVKVPKGTRKGKVKVVAKTSAGSSASKTFTRR